MDERDWKIDAHPCPNCRKTNVMYRIFESSDGAYEDAKYHCPDCGKDWWIDGIDS